MWYALRQAPAIRGEFASSAKELLQSTSRNLILATGIAYTFWHLIVTVRWPEEFGWQALAITPIVILTCFLSIRLVSRSLVGAQAVCQIGLAISIIVATVMFDQPLIAFFLALLPLMASVTVGWPMSVLSEGVVVALVFGK